MHWLFRTRQIDLEIQRLRELAYEDRDDLAIEDESVFVSRFGFDCSRFWREKVIEFKRKRDLTDRAICALYRNRTLTFGNGALEISTSPLAPALGWVQLALLVLPITHYCLLLICHPPLTLSTLAAVALFTAIYMAVPWSLYWYYIAPSRVWKRHIQDRERGFVVPI